MTMYRMTSIGLAGVAALTFLAIPLHASPAGPRCVAVSVESAIEEDGGRYKLIFTLANDSPDSLTLHGYEFSPDMLRLRAVSLADGNSLHQVRPMVSLAVGDDVNLAPGGRATKEVALNTYFPSLEKMVRVSDIRIAWELNVEPRDGCFQEHRTTSMLLRKAD